MIYRSTEKEPILFLYEFRQIFTPIVASED